MTTRAASKSKNKKPLETTLGKAPTNISDDPIDLSHLRKPIDTSIFGLRQVLQLYETATDEVRRYVTYECDIMYECRMCRTIFRSLANFILHKRNYCRETYNAKDHTNCRNNCLENELNIIQEEMDIPISTAIKEQQQNSGTSSPIPPPKCDSNKSIDCFQPGNTNSNSASKKNLSYVLRRLQGRQQSTLITEQCLSEDISNESKSSEKEEGKNNAVALEKITQATSGVFQTMFRNMISEYKGDMMKTEVMEIHNILENNEAILGSDGKIVTSETEKSANFVCTVCNQNFSTKKTLTYHIKYKHNNTRLVYRCPECNDIFATSWSVFRHLYKIHRKTTAQVKKLRNQVHGNIIRRDEQPETKNGNTTMKNDSEVIPDLQEKANLENQQWMDDLEGDNDLQRCGGCGRKFERKAALHSHSQFCSKRIAICNSLKENSAKRTTQSDKTKTSKTASNTNIDCMIKGSRRRKQLISQKMCRIDYVKDNEISSEKDHKNDLQTKEEVVNQNNELQTDVIEVRDDSNDSETEELLLIQNAKEKQHEGEAQLINVNLKPNMILSPILEEPQPFSRSESRCSDDVIYVDTIKLSPPEEESLNTMEAMNNLNEDKVKVSPTILKNNIITRSMRNVQKHTSQENLMCLNNNFTEELSDISIPHEAEVSINKDLTQEKIINFEEPPKEIEQNLCTENNKRKGIIEPQPGNSKRSKINEEETSSENIQSPKNSVIKTFKVTLETKSSKFINKEKHTCLPCKKTFKSNKSLMKHMAVHFNWYRYQCSKCSFMSYSRSKCDRHVEVKHLIQDEEMLKNFVMHVPNWKTLDKSTGFILCKKKCKLNNIEASKEKLINEKSFKDEEMEENKEEVQKEEKTTSVLEIETSTKPELVHKDENDSSSQADVQDPSLRKMIMEVIFGNQGESSTQKKSQIIPEPQDEESKNLDSKSDVCKRNSEESTEDFLGFQNCTETENQFKIENPTLSIMYNPRPIRNRVPTVQKDFLYDMGQILKAKPMKDKESNATSSHKEVEKKEKQKLVKMCTKESKPKQTIQLSIANNSKKVSVNKSVEHVQEHSAELVQDINMNSEDLKKHVI